MDGTHNAPLLKSGMEFDVVIGDSFREDSSGEFYSLRHDFLPASVDTSTPAQLVFENDKIKLQYQDGAGTADGTVFHGGLDVNKDGLDCALIFDGTDWRLEMVSGVANNLRTMRSPGRTPLMDHFPQAPGTKVSEGAVRTDEGPSETAVGIQDEALEQELGSTGVRKLEDHTGSGNEDLDRIQYELGASTTSRDIVQSASPEDRDIAESGMENTAASSGGDDDSRNQAHDSRQLRDENDTFVTGSPGDGAAESTHVGNGDITKVDEVQPPVDEINAPHSDRASSESADLGVAELEAALFDAMEGGSDSQSDGGESGGPPDHGNSIMTNAMPVEADAPSQTATPEMTCPPMSSSGKDTSSSSSSSSDSASGHRPNGVLDADTNGHQDVMVVDAENDMERDFFADDYMDEVPLVEPLAQDANGAASSSSSSSSSSSGSGGGSSSSEEEPMGGGPINEPEVDVF